jgi:hypothetical protein
VEEPGAITAAGSQSPMATMGPPDQGDTGSLGLEPLLGVKDRELPGPAPNAPDKEPGGWTV